MDRENLKLIVADDHPLFRAALKAAVQQGLGAVELVEADSAQSVAQAAAEHPDADLMLLDLHMPGAQGFSSLVYLRGRHPALPVIVISANADPRIVHQAIEYGASGFIPKTETVEDIAQGIKTVLGGEVWVPADIGDVPADLEAADAELARKVAQLTPQQFRVLMMLTEGLLNKQIAYELGVSEATIKAHVTAILRKLEVSNRTAAVIAAQKLIAEMPVDDAAPGMDPH